jgi:hypothetical protein
MCDLRATVPETRQDNMHQGRARDASLSLLSLPRPVRRGVPNPGLDGRPATFLFGGKTCMSSSLYMPMRDDATLFALYGAFLVVFRI